MQRLLGRMEALLQEISEEHAREIRDLQSELVILRGRAATGRWSLSMVEPLATAVPTGLSGGGVLDCRNEPTDLNDNVPEILNTDEGPLALQAPPMSPVVCGPSDLAAAHARLLPRPPAAAARASSKSKRASFEDFGSEEGILREASQHSETGSQVDVEVSASSATMQGDWSRISSRNQEAQHRFSTAKSRSFLDDYDTDDPMHHEVSMVHAKVWEDQIRDAQDRASAVKPTATKSRIISIFDRDEGTSSQSWHLANAVHERMGLRLPRYVADPSSKWRQVWDVLGSLFLFIDLVMIPLQFFGDLVNSESPPQKALSILTSSYWTFDIVSSFMVGYHNNGSLEMRPGKVAWHYLRTWFVLDLALVVIDWSFILLGLSQQASFMRVGKTMSRSFRVVRLLRIVKMHQIVNGMMERIHSEYLRQIARIVGLVLFVVMLNHFLGCGWYGLSQLNPAEPNWVERFIHEDEKSNFWSIYFTALHWSITQFTPAAMEVFPQNLDERIYNVAVVLFALITFSSFISSITQAMTTIRAIQARRLEQQAKLRSYLGEHNISANLVNRVWHFLHQHEVMRMSKVRTKESDVPALQLLPASMVLELHLEAYAPTLRKHPFFFHYGLTEPKALLQICNNAIGECSIPAKHELFANSLEGCVQMFFVQGGLMEYMLPCHCGQSQKCSVEIGMTADLTATTARDRDYVLALRQRRDWIKPGEWACEAALWAVRVELYGPFVALQNSDLLLIHKAEFQDIVMMYEGSRLKTAKYAAMFTEFMPHLVNCRWRTVICNDHSQCEDVVHRVFDYRQANSGNDRRKFRSGHHFMQGALAQDSGTSNQSSLMGWWPTMNQTESSMAADAPAICEPCQMPDGSEGGSVFATGDSDVRTL